jgi:hypothetical protein
VLVELPLEDLVHQGAADKHVADCAEGGAAR